MLTPSLMQILYLFMLRRDENSSTHQEKSAFGVVDSLIVHAQHWGGEVLCAVCLEYFLCFLILEESFLLFSFIFVLAYFVWYDIRGQIYYASKYWFYLIGKCFWNEVKYHRVETFFSDARQQCLFWSLVYRLIQQHIKKLSTIISPNHKDLRIPRVYHFECPWPAAQRDIFMINAYKVSCHNLWHVHFYKILDLCEQVRERERVDGQGEGVI